MKIALFFTRGISLRVWHRAGLIHRDTLLYRRLHEDGHEVIFVTYGDHDDATYLPEDLPFRVLTKPEGLSHRQYGRRVLDIHGDVLADVDLVKAHQVDGSIYALRAARKLGKPFHLRCGYLPSFFLRREKAGLVERARIVIEEAKCFRQADAFSVPSMSEVDYVCRRYRATRAKGNVCPNWVDTSFFAPDPALTKHPRRVCFIARFEQQKQPLLFLEAMAGIPDVDLVMVGGGNLRSRITALARKLNLDITVLDRQPNEKLPRILNESSVYVLPTLYEGGSPKSLLEAMACQLPVVSTDAFGVNEAFEDQVHGIKLAPDDLPGFRQAVGWLLENPAAAADMGARGRAHVKEVFSIEMGFEREKALSITLVGEDF
jgi:glycosyltransferase involved in cell wall biosynthesis